MDTFADALVTSPTTRERHNYYEPNLIAHSATRGRVRASRRPAVGSFILTH